MNLQERLATYIRAVRVVDLLGLFIRRPNIRGFDNIREIFPNVEQTICCDYTSKRISRGGLTLYWQDILDISLNIAALDDNTSKSMAEVYSVNLTVTYYGTFPDWVKEMLEKRPFTVPNMLERNIDLLDLREFDDFGPANVESILRNRINTRPISQLALNIDNDPASLYDLADFCDGSLRRLLLFDGGDGSTMTIKTLLCDFQWSRFKGWKFFMSRYASVDSTVISVNVRTRVVTFIHRHQRRSRR